VAGRDGPPKLIVLQNRPTQFDGPLYAYLHREAPFALKVYYSESNDQEKELNDPEIERAPDWDHLADCDYDKRFLSAQACKQPHRLADAIAAEGPALVILCGWFPPVHAQLAWRLKRRGIPIGLRTDNTLPHSDFSGTKGRIKRRLLPLWLERYDTWHPVGTLAREYLEGIAGTTRPTFYFPYNVDIAWFAEQAAAHREARVAARESLGLAEDDLVVLGIMKWHAREDPLTLLRAFAAFSREQPRARLLLVGDGPLRDAVAEAARPLGDRVRLPGYLPYSALPKCYAVSDVFVHPAVDECWGVSVSEAMACGVPVIASDGVGAAVDLVRQGETGAAFAAGDSAALAQRLADLCADPGRLAAMGRMAERQVAVWSYGQTLLELSNAVDAVLESSGD
jgi:glycosyltransferase involved in cell wall biosynthesis